MFRLQTLLRDRLAECICWHTSVYFSFLNWRNQISPLCMKLPSITSKISAHAYLEPIMKCEQYFADEIYTNLYIAINFLKLSTAWQQLYVVRLNKKQLLSFQHSLTFTLERWTLEGYKDLRCYFPYTGADNFTVIYRSVRYIGIIYLFRGEFTTLQNL